MEKAINEKYLLRFGEHVAKLRKANKLSQKDLAEKGQVDVSTVSRVERGLYNIKISTAVLLASALDVSIERLFDLPGMDDSKEDIMTENKKGPIS